MGMDVFGKLPANEAGKYFRNNVWWWRPLAIYVTTFAPEIASHCDDWHSNSGQGLDNEDSLALADVLQQQVDSGQCEAYAAIREKELAAMPDVRCRVCDGTGKRRKTGAGDHPCNGCEGTGSVRPWDAAYYFSVENVQEFITFLRGCGGFEIC